MRNLLIMVGAPGSGKSTWIKENELESYTLSPDTFRLMLASPAYGTDGKRHISQENDRDAWKLMDETLERRMEKGNFTIVDATHTRDKYLRRYKELADKYRYRLYVKVCDVALEELMKRNAERPEFKRVPESAIALHAERLKTLKFPAAFQRVEKIIEVNEFVRTHEESKPVYFIGDIQGCHDQLVAFLSDHGDEDAEFIFIGDYIDRGPENGKTMNLLIELAKKPNMTFLEGNHERWLWMWANDKLDDIRSREFMLNTKPQLDGVVEKKLVREFYRKLRTFVSIRVGERFIFASHGGVSHPFPDFITTEQLIHGVGKYEDLAEIYANWPSEETLTLVHGHRNVQKYPTQVAGNIFNLDGGVEFGGFLRTIKFDLNGSVSIFEYKNNAYVPREQLSTEEQDAIIDTDRVLEALQTSRFVKENKQGHISAFNFTHMAFKKGIWNKVSMRARGLFVNMNTKQIVARSYDKFFNMNEVEATTEFELAKNLKFPVNVYHKYNGFLGIVGYDAETDTVLYCSKSTINGDFAQLNKEVLEGFGVTEEKIRPFVIGGQSLIIEIIDPVKDPHIIEYVSRHAVLLDVVKNDWKYTKLPDAEVVDIATTLGIEHKEIAATLNEYHELSEFLAKANTSMLTEGYVIEDAVGFMFKTKGDFYRKWKHRRSLKDRVHEEHFRISDYAFDEEMFRFLTWAKSLPVEEVKGVGIIELRKKFLTV